MNDPGFVKVTDILENKGRSIMQFKEWILEEYPVFTLPRPTQISVWIDEQGTKVASYIIDLADIRAEDWNIEDKNRYTLDGGVQVSKITPKAPNGAFSAPLADGRFLNCNVDATLDNVAKYPVIRKDWARFAQLFNDNNLVKQANYGRTITSASGAVAKELGSQVA